MCVFIYIQFRSEKTCRGLEIAIQLLPVHHEPMLFNNVMTGFPKKSQKRKPLKVLFFSGSGWASFMHQHAFVPSQQVPQTRKKKGSKKERMTLKRKSV